MQIKNQQVFSVSWELSVSNLQIASPSQGTLSDSPGQGGRRLVAGDW